MDWECLLCFASRCGQDVIAHTHSSCWLFAFLSHHPATFFLFHFFRFLSTWSRRSRRLVENNFLLLCVHEPCQYNFIMRTQIKPTTTSVATKNQTKCTTKAMDKTYDETEQRILLTVHREGRKWCEWERNEIVNYFEERVKVLFAVRFDVKAYKLVFYHWRWTFSSYANNKNKYCARLKPEDIFSHYIKVHFAVWKMKLSIFLLMLPLLLMLSIRDFGSMSVCVAWSV